MPPTQGLRPLYKAGVGKERAQRGEKKEGEKMGETFKTVIIIITIVLLLFTVSFNYAPGIGYNNRIFDSPKLEKYSKYECGEESIDDLKNTEDLYIKYYMIALTYLLFDIEIILLFPYVSYLLSFNHLLSFSTFSSSFILFFFFFVLLGLFFEFLYGLFH